MYEPKVDDYVIGLRNWVMVHEGWVYFVSEEVKPKTWMGHTSTLYNH